MEKKSNYNAHDYALSFQRGEERGFIWFFRHYYPALTLFAYKLVKDKPTAEEIASTAFLKTWQKHFQFETPAGLRSYLYQVVRNDSLKWLEQAKKQQYALQEIKYLDRNNCEKDAFQHMVGAELTRYLAAVVDYLSPQCRKIYQMLYVEGKTVKETARAHNLSVSTVRTQQRRGLNAIRERMGLISFFVACFLQLYIL
jgi:RNA polymerase sigma-70 factor (ECF subfamily)